MTAALPPPRRWAPGVAPVGDPGRTPAGDPQAALLLRQAQLAAQEAYRRSAGLVRMLDLLGRGGTPDQLAERAVEVLSEIFSADLVLWGRTSAAGMEVLAACGFGDVHEPGLPPELLDSGFLATRTPGTWTAPAGTAPVVAGVAVRAVAHVPVDTPGAAGAAGTGGAALVLTHAEPTTLPPTDLLLLRSIAERLQSAVQDAERRQTVERLAGAAARLARHLEPEALLAEAVDALAEISGAAWTSAVTIEDGVAELTTTADWVVDDEARWPRQVTDLVSWPAALRGETTVVHDLAEGPDRLGPDLRGAVRSMLCIPVLVEGRPVVLLYAVDPRPGAFTTAAVDAAALLGGSLSAALVNARLYRALADSEARLRVLTDAISDMVAVIEPAGTVRWVSPSYARGLGVQPAELVGHDWVDRVHPADRAAVRRALRSWPRVSRVEHRLRQGTAGHVGQETGEWAWVETGLSVSPGEEGSTVLSSRFIGERRRLEDELRVQATHDSLTGLANRALVRRALEERLTSGPPSGVGVLFCDLDEFKAVNDRLGHEAGDDLLRQVADRLRECVRPGDLLARLGGDEFVVVLADTADRAVLTAVGARMLDALRRPFSLDGDPVRIGASVGGALGDRAGATAVSDLLRDADAAMYEAKRAGRGRVQVFDAAAAQRSVERLGLRQQVQGALAREELRVEYQPIVALAGGRVEGVEALLRWRHPTLGDVPPEVFVPLAEETGVIAAMGDWVADQTCRELSAWRALPGGEHLRASVNLSAVQLDDPCFVDRVVATMRRHGVPAGHLRLEVTENMERTPAQLHELHRLRDAGVSLVLDDFGVSYSNLAHVRDLPVDTLKIDRSFVQDLGGDSAGRRLGTGIVRAVMALSEAAGLAVVAEGVETEEHRDALLRLGCRSAQGWLFSPALDADRMTAVLVGGGVLAPVG